MSVNFGPLDNPKEQSALDPRLLAHYQKTIDTEFRLSQLETAFQKIAEERIQKRCKVILIVEKLCNLLAQLCRELREI